PEVPAAPEQRDSSRGPYPPRRRLAPLDRVAWLAVDRAVQPLDVRLEVALAMLGQRVLVRQHLVRRDAAMAGCRVLEASCAGHAPLRLVGLRPEPLAGLATRHVSRPVVVPHGIRLMPRAAPVSAAGTGYVRRSERR